MAALNLSDMCFIRNTYRGQKIKKGPWVGQKEYTSIKGFLKNMEQKGVNCGEGGDRRVEEGNWKG